jgi:hypothetical protein
MWPFAKQSMMLWWLCVGALLLLESEAFVALTKPGLPFMQNQKQPLAHKCWASSERLEGGNDAFIPADERIRGFANVHSSTKASHSLTNRLQKLRKRTSIGAIGLVGALMLTSKAAHAASSVGTSLSAAPAIPGLSRLALPYLLLLGSIHLDVVGLAFNCVHSSVVWYFAQLHARPIVTNILTAGVLAMIGDYVAQNVQRYLTGSTRSSSNIAALQSRASYNKRRGLSSLMDGLFISGPLMYFSYQLFERILPVSGGGSASALAAVLHVAADSIFLDSFFIATTIVVTGRFEGYSTRQLKHQLKTDYFSTLLASWVTSLALSPMAFLCFRYLPVSFRALSVHLLDFVWDTVISFMAHRNRHTESAVVEMIPCTASTVAAPSLAV